MSTLDLSPPLERQQGFSPDELERFRRDGYVIARQIVSPSVCDTMREVALDHREHHVPPFEYEADLNYPGAPSSRIAEGGQTVRRLKQAISRHAVFTEWLASPPLLSRLQQLLGPHVVCPLSHHNCIMTKNSVHSSETGWHQDIRYWSFERRELVSAWLALGTENEDNGCLHLIPGTHAREFDRARLDDQLFLRSDLAENRELIEQNVPAELQSGDVLFFHCRTFHAASRNRSPNVKLSAVFTFRPADNPPIPGSRSASLPELLLPAPLI